MDVISRSYKQLTKEFITQRQSGIPDRIKQWQKDLLRDVEVLPMIPGHKRGCILVYGEDAAPILCGQKSDQVIMAAAELGQNHGRVVILSHHAYLDKFGSNYTKENLSILHENINHWLTKGAFANKQDILNLKTVTESGTDKSKYKILLWDSIQTLSDEFDDEILEFIENGGSLLYALCPHNWESKFRNQSLETVPLMKVLQRVGVAFTSQTLHYSGKGFSTGSPSNHHESLASSHVRHLVKQCMTETSKQSLYESALLFLDLMTHLTSHGRDTLRGELKNLFEKCKEVVEKNIPNGQKKTKDQAVLAHLIISSILSETGHGYQKMPGIDIFPGYVTDLSKKCAVIEIKADVKQAHPTGYWVPAGHRLEVKMISQQHVDINPDEEDDSLKQDTMVNETKDGEENMWYIRIGCHSDNLLKCDAILRWPNIMTQVPLKSTQSVFTPYGGLLYLVSPNATSQVEIQISGVVEAPYFDLREPSTIENWDTIRQAPAPWADICGHFFRVSLPSSSIQDLENPTEVMKLWDTVVESNHQLRGTTAKKREWLVADVQPVIGQMHSGYPIVSLMYIAEPDGVLSLHRMQTVGFWGVFHELGHNMQRSMWTFEGTLEVTCNIFSLFAAEHVTKNSVISNEWMNKHTEKIKNYLAQGADFKKWQAHNGIALAFYGQLAHHFGWQTYRKVFWHYETLSPTERPITTQEKIDEWIMQFSEAVDHNLVPLAKFWGIPVTTQVELKLSTMAPFLPDDKMTALCTDRVSDILKQYHNVVRHIDKDTLNVDHLII